MMKNNCLFCDKNNFEKRYIMTENDLFYAKLDENPVSKGHAMVIPNEHIVSFFDLPDNTLISLFDFIKKVKSIIQSEHNPDAFNIGINDGAEAGRTIDHLHIHIIPRYKGDVENPRGGVRHIIPGKGNYPSST